MKPKYHLKKNAIFVQSTDGSVYKLNVFSKLLVLKLSIDPKSNMLWKCTTVHKIINKNYKIIFLKKFNYLKML